MTPAMSRRTFIASAAAATLLASRAHGQANPYTLRNIADFSDGQLTALRRGVQAMKARDDAPRTSADFRRSWVFWANVHGHYSPGEPRADGLRAWSPETAAERDTWGSCIHDHDDFLPWHRLYCVAFLGVLREAAGAPNFPLPYWDWTQDRRLPAPYRQAGPLFTAERAPGLNDGSEQLTPTMVSLANANAAGGYSQFRQRIENSPHGSVHVAVGGGAAVNGYMRAFASAANDPVFWAHHAMIDLAWARSGFNAPATLRSRNHRFISPTGGALAFSIDDIAPVDLSASVEPEARLWLAQGGRGRRLLIEDAMPADPADPGMYEVLLNGVVVGTATFFGADHAGHVMRTFDFDVPPGMVVGSNPRVEFRETTGLEPVPGSAQRKPMAQERSVRTRPAPRFRRAVVE